MASNPNSSVWLSANAGTGKTHVLINRIIRLLLEGNDPEKIICITYTNAAAVEMQNRIIEISQEWITQSDEKVNESLVNIVENKNLSKDKIKNLKKTLGLIIDFPDKLKIQTIHAFCQSVLKSFPIEAQITPFFEVMDESKKKIIFDKSFNSTFERAYNNKEQNSTLEDIRYLLTKVSTYSLKDTLFELINSRIKVNKAIKNHNDTIGYLSYLKEHLNINELDENFLFKQFKDENEDFLKTYINSLKNASSSFLKNIESLNNFLLYDDYPALSQVFLTQKGELRKNLINSEIAKKEPQLNESLSKLSSNFIELDDKIKSINIYKSTRSYLNIYSTLVDEYESQKRESALLDYDDLIEKTYSLFSNKQSHLRDWILYKLDGGIEHILLDEAQDTNPEQWEVIKAITEEFFSGLDKDRDITRTLFVVGDEKQSIYSFQGADFMVFNKMKEHFRAKFNSCEKYQFSEIPLNISFRSCPAILKIVDEILVHNDVKDNVSLNPESIQSHEAYRKGYFGYFELNPLVGEKNTRSKNERISWKLPAEYPKNIEDNNKTILAKQIAEKIRYLVDSKRTLPSTGEAVRYKDFMILLRKRANLFPKIIKELESLNIPVSGMDRLNLKENIAIMDLLSYAKFKLQPYDDLNLACLLKSPFFEVSEESLFALTHDRKQLSLFENLKLKSISNEEFKTIHDSLSNVLNSKENENTIDFFLEVLATDNNRVKFTNYYGFQIYEIFDEFINLVDSYQSSNLPSLQKFISWFENNDSEIKRNQESEKDAVRIMTIHGSKGLQSPIVIMPDTTLRTSKASKNIINDNFIICPDSSNSKTFIYEQHEKQSKQVENAENKRLLYVALTRAKDELYIFGDKSDDFEKDDCWYNIIKNSAENICKINDDGKLILTNNDYINYTQNINTNPNKNTKKIEENNFPDFLFSQPSGDINLEIVRPSELRKNTKKIEEKYKKNKFNFTEKGNYIHKLLEILPAIKNEEQNKFIKLISQNYNLNEEETITYTEEALNVLNNAEFSYIFNGKSSAELTINGIIDNKLILGQIDRLVELDDNNLLIIDYKTSEITTEEVYQEALSHKMQLSTYKYLLEKVYPSKNIKMAILFTHPNILTFIDD